MTDQSKLELKGAQFVLSPAQELFDEAHETLCSVCPLARWYKRVEWYCFCSEFKKLMYEGPTNVAPVVVCDARELEIMRLNDEANRG